MCAIAGVILNKVGSDRHEAMLRQALEAIRMPIVAVIRKDAMLALPERHLGLVQAGEHGALEDFIDYAAECRFRRVQFRIPHAHRAAGHEPAVGCQYRAGSMPLGQAYCRRPRYRLCLLLRASAARLAAARRRDLLLLAARRRRPVRALPMRSIFRADIPNCTRAGSRLRRISVAGMKAAAARGARIYGECGGYMVLGEGLIDGDGERHEMLGLLPLVTSYADAQAASRLSPCHAARRRVFRQADDGA